ncbi:kinase-like protein [Rhizophagus irregularis]|uniref:Kinase-like protein n=2 Tax=Rhizophagus irregularis TaxID=588596 RepID=A0A2N0QV13_9GLOM|nr:kinase-like protein [Rhizophagus irregularis]
MNTDNNPFDPTPKLKSSPVPVLFIPFKNNEEKCNYCGIEYSETLKLRQKYCKNCLFWYIQYITDNNTHLDARISTNNSQCIKHKATRNNFYSTNIQEWCEYCSEILYFTQVVTKDKSLVYCYNLIPDYCDYQFSSAGWVESTLTKKSIPILYLPWWDNIRSENYIIEEFLASTRINNKNLHSIANYMKKTTRSPFEVHSFIRNNLPIIGIEWIPYSQITNLKKIAEGGFSIIYKATWEGTDVAVKKLRDSQNISKHFLNELRSLYQCKNYWVIDCYGITQDPITKEYMLILPYAEGGNLHDYLQKNFINLRWDGKLFILQGILFGLENIHKNNFIHRDIHSGNMLLSNTDWKVGDLGLSQPANNTLSNNEIYGVIPYIAPEIFKGAAFSKESDIYSFGMIMWELTTGCKPFANIEHNLELIYEIIDGKRPEITNDTPECFINLMKKCWDSDPLKRPTRYEIRDSFIKMYGNEILEQAEKKRLELIQLKQLGPEFSEKSHPKAIYTSRALSSLISKASTINSSSMISYNVKQEYITREYEFDINNIQRSSTQNTNSATQSLTVPVKFSRKRNFEELNNETNETQENRKYTKVDNSR